MNIGGEMGIHTATENLHKIDRPVPFLAPILKKYDLSVEGYKKAISEIPKSHLRSWNLVQMVRRIDGTGVIPYLIDEGKDATDIYRDLIARVKGLFTSTNNEDMDIILSALYNNTSSPYCLLLIDDKYKSFIEQLRSSMSPKAEEFRRRNSEALTEAIRKRRSEPRHYQTLGISNAPTLEDASSSLVSFYPKVEGGKVVDIHQQILVPSLPEENAELLDSLTPNIFKSDRYSTVDLSPEEIFLLRGGIFGAPMLRLFVGKMRRHISGNSLLPVRDLYREHVESRP